MRHHLHAAALAAMIMLCALSLPVRVRAADAGTPTQAVSADDRFFQSYYYPAKDPNQGSLYPAVARLLELVRQKLPLVEADVAAMPTPPPGVTATAAPAPAPAPPEESWVRVMTTPAGDDEEIAFSCLMSGAYDRAADIYRRLLQKRSADAHLRLMLALCEKNMGDTDKAQTDLAEAGRSNADMTPWTTWMSGMIILTSSPKETPK